MSEILNILGSVGFNWHVALANFVNFLIILFLLNKFFFGKIGKTLDERKRVIERGLTQAHDAEQKLAHAEEEKKGIVSSAYKEKERIIVEAEASAQNIAEMIKRKTEDEMNAKLERINEQEKHLKENLEKEFMREAPKIVASLYAKTLQKEMSQDENNALIGRMTI